MRKKKHNKDPLFGFGWAGCVSGVILIALVSAIVAGVELRYELMKLVVSTLGVDAMMYFVHRLPFLGFAIFGQALSIPTGIAVLIAFKLLPYRIHWLIQLVLFLVCSFWFLVVLEVYLVFTRTGFFDDYLSNQLLEVFGIVFVGGVVVFLTRSRVVLVLWGMAALLVFVNALWYSNYGESPLVSVILFYPFDSYFYTSLSLVFDLLTIGSLLVWAVLERRKVLTEHMCESCGYDLIGLEDVTACPECGEKLVVEQSNQH